MRIGSPISRRRPITPVLLQGSHRLTIIALICAAAAVGCVLTGRQTAVPLAIAMASAVGGLCLTLMVLSEYAAMVGHPSAGLPGTGLVRLRHQRRVAGVGGLTRRTRSRARR